MRHLIDSIEGLLVTAVLVFWVGLDFYSWQFWGPFLVWALIASAASTASRHLA